MIAFFLFAVEPLIQAIVPPNTNYTIELLILAEVIAALGVFLLAYVFISYTREVNPRILPIGGVTIITIPILAYFLSSFEISFIILELFNLMIVLGLGGHIISARRTVPLISKNSSVFLLATLIIALGNILLSIPLNITIELLDIVELITRMGASLMIAIAFVHFEYSILTAEKSDLKDKYSHDLGNILQIILGATQLVQKQINQEKKYEEKFVKIETNLDKASDLINKIRQL
jgi:signal transduction histidine kinase